MSEKPIVAIVLDEDGTPSIRAAGDVTVVWVDERTPHDRVFETNLREPMDELRAFIGERDTWGCSGDERQKRLAIQIANINGPALTLVENKD